MKTCTALQHSKGSTSPSSSPPRVNALAASPSTGGGSGRPGHGWRHTGGGRGDAVVAPPMGNMPGAVSDAVMVLPTPGNETITPRMMVHDSGSSSLSLKAETLIVSPAVLQVNETVNAFAKSNRNSDGAIVDPRSAIGIGSIGKTNPNGARQQATVALPCFKKDCATSKRNRQNKSAVTPSPATAATAHTVTTNAMMVVSKRPHHQTAATAIAPVITATEQLAAMLLQNHRTQGGGSSSYASFVPPPPYWTYPTYPAYAGGMCQAPWMTPPATGLPVPEREPNAVLTHQSPSGAHPSLGLEPLSQAGAEKFHKKNGPTKPPPFLASLSPHDDMAKKGIGAIPLSRAKEATDIGNKTGNSSPVKLSRAGQTPDSYVPSSTHENRDEILHTLRPRPSSSLVVHSRTIQQPPTLQGNEPQGRSLVAVKQPTLPAKAQSRAMNSRPIAVLFITEEVFHRQLVRMINETESTHPEIFHWANDGMFWAGKPSKVPMEATVLRFFQYKNYKRFRHHLNFFGWYGSPTVQDANGTFFEKRKNAAKRSRKQALVARTKSKSKFVASKKCKCKSTAAPMQAIEPEQGSQENQLMTIFSMSPIVVSGRVPDRPMHRSEIEDTVATNPVPAIMGISSTTAPAIPTFTPIKTPHASKVLLRYGDSHVHQLLEAGHTPVVVPHPFGACFDDPIQATACKLGDRPAATAEVLSEHDEHVLMYGDVGEINCDNLHVDESILSEDDEKALFLAL